MGPQGPRPTQTSVSGCPQEGPRHLCEEARGLETREGLGVLGWWGPGSCWPDKQQGLLGGLWESETGQSFLRLGQGWVLGDRVIGHDPRVAGGVGDGGERVSGQLGR